MSRNVSDLRKRLLDEVEKKKKNQEAAATTPQSPSGGFGTFSSNKNNGSTTTPTRAAATPADTSRNAAAIGEALKRNRNNTVTSLKKGEGLQQTAPLLSDGDYTDYWSRMRTALDTPRDTSAPRVITGNDPESAKLNNLGSNSKLKGKMSDIYKTEEKQYEALYGLNRELLKRTDTMEQVDIERKERTDEEITALADNFYAKADNAATEEEAAAYRNAADNIMADPEAYRYYDAAPTNQVSADRSALEERARWYNSRAQKARENTAFAEEGERWEGVDAEARNGGWQFSEQDYNAFRERVYGEQNAAAATMPDIYSIDMRAHYTPEEASNYEYLRVTYGQGRADEYANYLQPIVAERRNANIAADMQDGSFIEQAGAALFSTYAGAVNGVDILGQYIDRKITGSNMPIDVHTTGNLRVASNTGREASVAAANELGTLGELTNSIFGTNISSDSGIWSYRLGDLLNWGYDTVNSRAGGAMFGGGGNSVLMMLSAFANNAVDAQERGGTNDEMIAFGGITGAAEGATELISYNLLKSGINKMFGNGKGGWRFPFAIALGTAVEFTEGGSQEVVNDLVAQWADSYVMGENSEWQLRVRELVGQGYSQEEAEEIASREAGDALLKTFIFGGLGQGLSYAIGAPLAKQQERVTLGQSIRENNNFDTMQDVFANAYGKPIDGNISNARLGRMYSNYMQNADKMVANAVRAEDDKAVLDYYEQMRNAQNPVDGTTSAPADAKQIKRIQQALIKKASGGRVSGKQEKMLQGDNAAQQTLAALGRHEIEADRTESNQRREDITRASLAPHLPSSLTTPKKTTTTQTGTSEEMAAKATAVHENMNVSDDGNAHVGDETITDDIKFKEVSEDGNAVVTVTTEDGTTRDVDIDEVMFADDRQSEVMAYASVMATPELANQFVAMASTTDVALDQLSNGMNQAYDMALSGYKLDYVQRSALTEGLTNEQVATAYNMGAAQRKTNIATEQQRIAERQKNFSGKGWKGGKLDYGTVNYASLDARRQQQVDALEAFAAVSGINIELFESKANENGKHVGEQGQYIRYTNTIRIDINAGLVDTYSNTPDTVQTAMLRTLSHEVTHAIQRNNIEAYNDLKTAVLDVLAERGFDLEGRVDAIIDNDRRYRQMKGIEGKDMTRDQALDEVVADACEMMLRDTDAVERLAKNHPAEAKTLGQKILQILKKWRDAIAQIFGDTHSREAKALANALNKDIDRIEKLWSDALAQTAEVSGQELAAREDGVTTVETAMSETMDGATDTNGNDLFSLRTMQEDKDTYREMLLQHGNMTAAEIDKLFNTIDTLMMRIEEDRLILDFGENIDSDNRSFTPVKPNSDPLYQVSVDFSTLCRKRLLQQACQERLEAEMGRAVTKAERVAIREKLIELQQHGKQIEVACALCYVESARLKSPAQIQKFMDNREEVIRNYFARKNPAVKQLMADAEAAYRRENNLGDGSLKELGGAVAKKVRAAKNAPIAQYTMSAAEQQTADKAMAMGISDFTTAESLWKLKADDPVLFDIYTSYIRNATKSKGIEGDTPWKAGDSKAISDELIEKMNEENGLRSQSWSDFQTYHILDYIGAAIELSTRNAKMQSYTKVPAYVELMGETGIMINMSLIPAAKFDGTLQFDDTEGIIHSEAFRLREKYPETAGTICIGIEDNQIRMLLADDTIDYVIPYHRSGMDAATRKKMRIPTWKDYEKYQNEKPLGSNAGKPPKFSEWFDYDQAVLDAEYANNTAVGKAAVAAGDVMYGARVAMQNAAQRYIDLCAERNLAPKFANFTNEANYWKLLIDRKMINNKTGAIIKQGAVKPVFNQDTLIKICDDEVANFKQNNADFQQAVDAVVDAQRDGTLGKIAGSQKVQQIVRSHEDWVTVQAAVDAKVNDRDVQHDLRDISEEGESKVTPAEASKMDDRQLNDTYMDAYNRGDGATMRVALDVYAARKGYNSGHLYHGTRSYGFTEFDLGEAAFGTSIFTTSSLRVAESYTPWGTVRKLTDKVADNFADMTTEQLLDVYTRYTGDKLYPVTPKNRNECYDLVRKGLDRIINDPEAISKRDELIASNPNLKQHISRLEAMLKRFASKNKMLSSFMVTYRQNQLGKVANQVEDLGGAEYLAIIEQRVAGRLIEMHALLTGGEIFFSRYGDNIALHNRASMTEYLSHVYPNQKMGVYDLYAKMNGLFMVDVEGRKWFNIDGAYIDRPGKTVKTDDVCAYAAQNGFKGVCFRNINDPGTQRNVYEVADSVVAVFDPKAVKSADLVTLDAKGDIIPLSQRFNDETADIRYSQRDLDEVSDREILANALEGIAETKHDKQLLAGYQKQLNELVEAQAELDARKETIKELSKRKDLTAEEKTELSKAEARAEILRGKLARADEALLKLERSEPLRNIVEMGQLAMEIQMGAKSAKAERELRERYEKQLQRMEQRYRREYEKTKDLEWEIAANKLAAEMHEAARLGKQDSDFLAWQMAEGAKNAKFRREMFDSITRYRERINTMHNQKATATLRAKITKKAKALDNILRGGNKNTFVPDNLRGALADALNLLTNTYESKTTEYGIPIERNSVFGSDFGKDGLQRFERLRMAYDAMREEGGELAEQYDEEIAKKLLTLSLAIDGKDIKALDRENLQIVNDVMNHFKHIISNANKMFIDGRRESIEAESDKFMAETDDKVYLRNKINQSPVAKLLRDGQTTAPYFFRRLGGVFGKLGNDLLNAESTYGVLYGQYTERVQAILKQFNHKEWADRKNDTLTITTNGGKEVTLSREQALSVYATYERQKRDTTHRARHLNGGGISLKVDNESLPLFGGVASSDETIPLTPADIKQFTNWLTPEQKAYADAMVKLMSTDLAELGNETSRILHGWSKFREGYYFPYVVDRGFLYTELGKAEDAVTLFKNVGFSKSVQDSASKPIIVSDFTQVATQHINTMLMYHAFAVPQDNMMRLLNHHVSETQTVGKRFERAFGDGAKNYLMQLMRDLYGNTAKDPADMLIGKMVGRARKTQVLYNLSVVLQQPSSIARAFAVISPKYIFHKPEKGAWKEALKYSGTANLKAVGGFDVSNARNFADAMASEKRADGVMDAIDKIGGWAPGKMDEATWGVIWNAVKREQAAKTGLSPKSEELLKLAGKRFDEVIRLTQVYDSTLSRSQNMRSKSTMMKAFTAFMGEPTVTYNMAYDLLTNKNMTKGERANTAAAITANILLNALLKSLVTAARDDDDEEETYWERYVKNFTSDVVSSINPLNYIPIAKDAWSTMLGFTSERPDAFFAEGLVDIANMLLKDDKSGWDIAEATVKLLSETTGIPVSNVWREIEVGINVGKSWDNDFRDGWLINALKTGGHENIPFLNKILPSPAEKLFRLANEGDMVGYKKQRKYMHDYKGKDRKEINSAGRTEVKEAYLRGDISKERAAWLVDTYFPSGGSDTGDKYAGKWEFEKIYGFPYTKMEDYYLAGEISYEEAVEARQRYGGIKDPDKARETVDGWKNGADDEEEY